MSWAVDRCPFCCQAVRIFKCRSGHPQPFCESASMRLAKASSEPDIASPSAVVAASLADFYCGRCADQIAQFDFLTGFQAQLGGRLSGGVARDFYQRVLRDFAMTNGFKHHIQRHHFRKRRRVQSGIGIARVQYLSPTVHPSPPPRRAADITENWDNHQQPDSRLPKIALFGPAISAVPSHDLPFSASGR